MKLYPNCKINLGLRVVRKREDGYHDIETVFVPIYGLHDELEVSINDGMSRSHSELNDGMMSYDEMSRSHSELNDGMMFYDEMSRSHSELNDGMMFYDEMSRSHSELNDGMMFYQEGIAVDCKAEDNLIVKCYRRMRAKYPQIGNVSVRFKKNIPFGAGLGGGSSDAAHMAIALNELFGLGLSKAELADEIRPLGADCPFFIYNRPCYAEGIGELLTPIDIDMRGIRIVLIKPDEGVSTKEAYSGITKHPEVEGEIRKAVATMRQKCTETDYSVFVNDFEASVFPNHPAIAEIKKRLLDAGAFYASMSGSGSTVFGLFEEDTEGSTYAQLRALKDEFASMVLLDDTFGEWKS